jgi:hypothetical protein
MKQERRGFREDENARGPRRENDRARLGLLSRQIRRLGCSTTESIRGRRDLLRL